MAAKTATIFLKSNKKLTGHVALPGSKSITNRALLVAALSVGESRLTGVLRSDDTNLMIDALRKLGAEITEINATELLVIGKGKLDAPDGPLFLGNAGTAMRFLSAAAILVDGEVVLDGDEHMQKRPIGALEVALKAMGADARSLHGCPPISIVGNGSLDVDKIVVSAKLSSQFVSGVMMAAACATKPITVTTPEKSFGGRGYIDITIGVMRAFGAKVEMVNEHTWIVQPTGFTAREFAIEPDASAATYLWAAAKLTGSDDVVKVDPEQMIQPDAKAYKIISSFPNMPAVIDGEQMQDAVPTMAVMAAFNNTPVRFIGIENLRVKECDRISALCTELNRVMPGLAYEDGDELVVEPNPILFNAMTSEILETYADHRMAMSFSLFGLLMQNIKIANPNCVKKTYPNYWKDIEKIGASIEMEYC